MSEFVKFQLIKHSNKDLDVAFQALVKKLKDFPERRCIKFTIIDKDQQKTNIMSFGKGESLISTLSDQKVDIEIRINQEDAFKLFQGIISPIELLLTGRMGFSGNVELAPKILKKIGTSGTKYSCE